VIFFITNFSFCKQISLEKKKSLAIVVFYYCNNASEIEIYPVNNDYIFVIA